MIKSLLVWVVSFLLALRWGAVNDATWEMIWLLRFPRALLASAVGMGLAVTGAALQALFANPLCEPYTLGISSGAALGAVIGVSLGIQWSIAGLAGTAFIGALVFAALLYLISHVYAERNSTLLLAGVMLGFFGNSWLTLWISLADSQGLSAALVWLFGDLSRARLSGALVVTLGVGAGTLLIWSQWRSLDALLMGEEGALALGVHLPKIQRLLILLTSLVIGLCVSAGGIIGFVGLVIPHFVRRKVGSLHFRLIPLCAIWGATALTAADCLARSLARPYELPVGVVTAFVGSPILMALLFNRDRKWI